MVGRHLVGFVWLNLLFSESWLVDFQWASCVSIFSFLCHGWQTFSGLRVSQYLDFCVMVGILLVGFVWLNRLFSVSWLVDFQWGSCGSIFSFLCHGRQTFSGVLVAQSLVFCVMIGRHLVGFVWLNLQISVSWLVDFQWGSCGSNFSFLCHGRQTFSGVRVAQSFVFCVMVGRLVVGFVRLNLQFFASWLVDFQWGSCGSNFSFLSHGRQTFSGVRVAQSLVFCVMVGRLLVGFVRLNLQFSGSRLATFSGVRVAQSLLFCLMVGRILVGFVWLNLLFSVSWLVDFQWGSCGGIVSFLCHGRQIFSGVRVAQSSFLCHGWQTFSGVRVAQSLGFCVMVGRLLAGLVWLNLQFYVSWLIDFQWGSCGSIFSFLCHGRQTFSGFRVAQSLVLCHGRQIFSGVRVAQSLVFCVMVGRLLVGFRVAQSLVLCHGRQTFSGVRVAQSLVFCVMVGRFQWASCGSIFSFLCHGRYTFSGVRVALQTFNGVRVSQSLVFCVMVGRLLVEFVWFYLLFSVLWQVDFQWGSCGSIFRFLRHVRQTFSGFRVSQSLVFCIMVDRLLVGFVWLNLQFSVSWQINFQWGSCGSIFCFLCHGWQTFSGVGVAQSLGFCVMVGRLLTGFVWLNLQFSVSWLVDFQWGSCGGIVSFLCHGRQIFSGVRVAQSSFLCHGWQTFSGVRVAQSFVFCVMVGRLLVGFVWWNRQLSVSWQVDFQWGSCGSIQFSVSWLVDFQWGSCGSIFRFLCHGWQTFSGARVAQSLVLCVMVDRLLVGFVWFNLQFSVSWQVDFQWVSCRSIFSFVSWQVDIQWGSCGSIFSFLCHGRQTFSGVSCRSIFSFVSWQVDV